MAFAAGFVLVGGRSTRMGRDKALLPFQGRPLVERIGALVLKCTGSLALIGDPERYGALGFPVYPDFHIGCGPLAGLEAALSLGLAEWNLIVACDLPFISETVVDQLLERTSIAKTNHGCVIPFTTARPQPLCGVYHSTCLEIVQQALSRQRLKMRALLSDLNVTPVQIRDDSAFINLNTPEDLAACEQEIFNG